MSASRLLRPAPPSHPLRPRAPARPADSALCALYARLVLPASAAVLAVLAATSLAAGPRMCARVLESPGVEAPLAELHKVFHLLL